MPIKNMVALMAMVGNSLTQDYLTRDIVFERLFCGCIGMLLAVSISWFIRFATKEKIYEPARELV